MGMQSFDKKGSQSIKKADVIIAKNYLNEEEIQHTIADKRKEREHQSLPPNQKSKINIW